MSTKIAWTDETWNPILGCSKVHTGCTNCYAEVMASRKLPGFGPHNSTVTNRRWNGSIVFRPELIEVPFRWKKGRKIFVTSMSDLGHENLSDEQRAIIYGVMLLNPHHTFQNLTKRPGNLARFKREWTPIRCWGEVFRLRVNSILTGSPWMSGLAIGRDGTAEWRGRKIVCPKSWEDARNIHEYVSVSDQPTLDAMAPELLKMPAAVRGVSYEPAVGPVDFGLIGTVPKDISPRYRLTSEMIHHIIVGGESGQKARPCDLAWIRSVVNQCRDAGCPVFVKQLGSNAISHITTTSKHKTKLNENGWLNEPKGGNPAEWPEDLRVQMQVGEVWR